MVNVSGGFAYIDMSAYGAFTSGTAKEVDLTIGDTLGKVKQTAKPVIVNGLQVDDDGTVTTIPAAFAVFLPTEGDLYGATILCGNDTYVAIDINGDSNEITVTVTT